MWGIVLAMAVGGLIMGCLIVAFSDGYQYLERQRRLRKERKA